MNKIQVVLCAVGTESARGYGVQTMSTEVTREV